MGINEFIEKFADALEIEDVESLSPETQFRDLDEWSSISVMEFIVLAKNEFGKSITDAEVRKSLSLQDLYNQIND